MNKQKAFQELRQAGHEFGASFSNLAASKESVLTAVNEQATQTIKAIEQENSGQLFWLHFINTLLFLVGTVLFFVSFANVHLWQAWTYVSIAWLLGLFALIVARASINIGNFASDPKARESFVAAALVTIESRKANQRAIRHESREKRGQMPSAQPFGVSHEGEN